MSDLETRKFALAEAVKIVGHGTGETWAKRADAAMEIADLFVAHLDPEPTVHAQADAKRSAA